MLRRLKQEDWEFEACLKQTPTRDVRIFRDGSGNKVLATQGPEFRSPAWHCTHVIQRGAGGKTGKYLEPISQPA